MFRAIVKNLDFFRFLLVVVVVMVAAGGLQPASGQPGESEVWRFVWSPPSFGSDPDHYVVQIRVDGTAVETRVTANDAPEVTFDAVYGRDYEVRAAAVDALGRQGQYSDWSFRKTCELAVPSR